MSDKNEKPRNPKFEERVAQARIVRKIVFYSILALVVVVGVLIGSGYFYITNALSPVDESETETTAVTIPIGSSTTQISTILENEGLIRNSTIFRYYVRYKNESGFQAGDYALSPSMTIDEIIDELKEGRVIEEPKLIFTVPEGQWLVDAVARISDETGHSEEDILQLINDEDYLTDLISRYWMLSETILQEEIKQPLEGYLFPARYDFMEEEPTIETVIEAMLARTQQVLDPLRPLIEESEYSVHEILTLASIIEREAQQSEDRYTISGVLYNRLDQGMMLQVDPTVAYAIGEHRYMTTFADLEVDSPYNTYRNAGIPIGPIASPGEDSIKAALQPEETDYLFFYARFNGEVIYNETYEAHQRTHEMYRDEWVEGQQEDEDEE